MIEEKNSSGINDFSEKPHINIEHIDPAQLKTYKEFRDFQLIGQILFQWEAQRLDKQSGKDHPRVRLFKERLKQKKAFLADVEVELEIARIKVPKVSEDGALIHGRICDEKNRGLARLIVING